MLQSTAICSYPWHLLHLVTVLILTNFFGTVVSVIYFGVLVFNIIPLGVEEY